MKFKHLFVILGVMISTSLFAQTKLISHKSHSGSTSNFAIALEKNLFDIKDSNFGVAPIRGIKKAQLDSLIFLTDTSVVMVTSEYCGWVEEQIKKPKKINNPKKWQAGTDTVFHHKLFSRKNSIEKIKKKLEKDYFFKNAIDSIKFVNHEVPQIVEKESKKRKTKKDIRKQKRKVRKEERKYKRWAKKNCDCDCDCNEEQQDKNKNQKQNENENAQKDENQNNNNFNNTLAIINQMLPPIGGIGLFAILFGLLMARIQGRI